MLSRRTLLTATAGGLALTATPALASPDNLKSLVDSRAQELTRYDTAAIGAFRGRQRYSVRGDAIFQIGSISKTFTALALAIADRSGRQSLDDPLTRYIPQAPAGITLAHLASQTSGLDRLPPGLVEDPEFDISDPYANFGEADLLAALAKTTLVSPPGTKYLYSNYGFGLLGEALTGDYGAMIRHRIALPLRLQDTGTTLTPGQRRRKVQGYDSDSAPTPDWTFATLHGAGALYGTADDLLRYARAHLGDAPRHLKPALDLVQQPRFTIDPETWIGLGWHITSLPSGRSAIWHDGGTGGFTSIVGFCPEAGTGVAILVNAFLAQEIFAVAFDLLDAL